MSNTILLFLGIDLAVMSLFAGVSLLTWLFLLLASFVFKFCAYHRTFLYYVLTIDVINWIDYLITIPISTYMILTIESIIAGITLIIALWLYVRNNKKSVASNN